MEPVSSVFEFLINNKGEFFIIASIIIMQFYLGYRLLVKIAQYTAIFDKEDLPTISHKPVSKEVFDKGNVDEILSYEVDEFDEDLIEITYLEDNKNRKKTTPLLKWIPFLTTSNSDIMGVIVHYINVYLIKNRGASMDFHLIKDIVDKHTENLETQIENRIPAPLYLGLAATMIGIIIGLFSVNFGVNGGHEMDAIQPLINGVKLAMIGSVSGLIITTIFSIKIYKDAQTETGDEKSEFLSKLQSELMPRMAKGKLPEVAILSDKLDDFARTTTSAVSQLDDIVKTSNKTVSKEKQLISEIRKLDVAKITTANVEVFNNLEEMMGSFQNFAKYYEELDKSMLNTSKLLSNLQQFVKSTEDINDILSEVKATIQQGNEASKFFNKHIQSFEKYSDAVREAVANNDSAFRDAIEQLRESTTKQFEKFNELISEFDSKLSDAFTKSVEKFTDTMDEQVRRTEEAFEKGRPKFEKLDNLDKLDKLEIIEERLNSIEEQLTDSINKGNRDIIAALNNINSSVKSNSNTSAVSTMSSNGGTKQIELHNPKKTTLDHVVTGLKIATYLVIIVYGVYSGLHFFKIV